MADSVSAAWEGAVDEFLAKNKAPDNVASICNCGGSGSGCHCEVENLAKNKGSDASLGDQDWCPEHGGYICTHLPRSEADSG